MNKMNIGDTLQWMLYTIKSIGIVTDACVYSCAITMEGVTDDGLRIAIKIEEEEKDD